MKNNASTTVAETKFYYDNATFGSTTKGNLTKEENWIGGSTYASTTKGYNSYGLIASSTDPRGATTTLAYETNNLYVATTTNALGHTTGALYDYAKGAAKRTIDAHGLVRTFTFDPVGRLTEEKQPDLTTPSTLVTSKTYTYTDTFPNSVQTQDLLHVGDDQRRVRVPRRSRAHHSRAGAGGREQHVRREGLHLRDARASWRRNRCRTSHRRRREAAQPRPRRSSRRRCMTP